MTSGSGFLFVFEYTSCQAITDPGDWALWACAGIIPIMKAPNCLRHNLVWKTLILILRYAILSNMLKTGIFGSGVTPSVSHTVSHCSCVQTAVFKQFLVLNCRITSSRKPQEGVQHHCRKTFTIKQTHSPGE